MVTALGGGSAAQPAACWDGAPSPSRDGVAGRCIFNRFYQVDPDRGRGLGW